MIFMIKHNVDQEEVFFFVKDHNLLMTGEAGDGKR